DSRGGQLEMGLMSAILLLLAGIVLLITAVKTWFKETDPDAPPSKWMAALNRMPASGAFGMAAVMMFLGFKQWVFTLSAIAVIDEAEAGKIASVLIYLLFIVAAQALMLAPIIASALAPAQSSKIVGAMLGWLERHSRAITIVVSLFFAVWFISKSVSQLLRA
ncbi:MAG TPA: GAP family protein, partial [Verrucomicrobiae bacterium]|nr:GAP family protein [Verrucomicrobiae bacterium]